jgi:hypothetical protein
VSLEKQKPPDVLAEQRASNKLVKLIRRLRWMGMEKAESTEGAGPPRRFANGQRVGSSARGGLAPVGSENFIHKDSRT